MKGGHNMFTSTYTGEGAGVGGGMFGSWGFIIFFLFILWFFFGMNKEDYCNQDARADRIREKAEIEYKQLEETRNSKEAIMAQASAIRNEQQAETIFDLKIENTTLKQNNVLLEKFAQLEKQYAGCCCELNRRLDSIECNMLPKPKVFGQGYVTTGTPIPANSGFLCNC